MTVVSSPKQTEIIETTNIIVMKQREGVAIWTRKAIIIKKLDIKQDLIVEQKPIEVKRKKRGKDNHIYMDEDMVKYITAQGL